MFSPETLERMNAEAVAKNAAKRKEKDALLTLINDAKDVDALRNIVLYVVDKYVLREEKDGSFDFKSIVTSGKCSPL